MRLTTDIFEYCREQVPEVEHDLDLRLPHPREGLLGRPGGRLHALERDRLRRGGARARASRSTSSRPRLAFFFNCHNNVFQEIAKFRAVRRMWAEDHARALRLRPSERSQMIRFHTQTGGVTLQAQQPEVNIIRVALQGFAAVCGGTQSLHTNGFDEALALPTERSARIALRTQQVLAHESGVADTVDPFAGSYFIESLTDEIESAVVGADGEGGASSAARSRRSSSSSARSRSRPPPTTSATEPARTSIVGVNKYVTDRSTTSRSCKIDPETERRQVDRLTRFKEARDARPSRGGSQALRDVAGGEGNLLYPINDALRGPGLDRRGVRRDARRLRRVQGRRVLLARPQVARLGEESAADGRSPRGWNRRQGERS